MTFQIRKNDDNQYFFRVISSNFVLIAVSGSYYTYDECLNAVRTLCEEAGEASIYNQTEWHL